MRGLEGLAEEVKPLRGTPGPVRVEEAGLGFSVDLLAGQKTGWFFDQRENRARVARLAAGATVLDAFCHTGGFGLAAAAAGAEQVTLLDRSAPALELALAAARDNGLAERVSATRGEALETMERMVGSRTRFDIVVADPPAFAKSRKDQPAALRGYGKLARLAAGLVAPGGFLFIASCSHHVSPGGRRCGDRRAGSHPAGGEAAGAERRRAGPSGASAAAGERLSQGAAVPARMSTALPGCRRPIVAASTRRLGPRRASAGAARRWMRCCAGSARARAAS
ncbi:class I SAM-dependent methyltransferase [Siccirubricoccus deserti]